MNNDEEIIASVLSNRVIQLLRLYGIDTIDLIIENYPEKLLRISGFGLMSLRAVEDAFLSGARYKPNLVKSPNKKRKSRTNEDLTNFLRGKPIRGYEILR